jgi:hypothetical protein
MNPATCQSTSSLSIDQLSHASREYPGLVDTALQLGFMDPEPYSLSPGFPFAGGLTYAGMRMRGSSTALCDIRDPGPPEVKKPRLALSKSEFYRQRYVLQVHGNRLVLLAPDFCPIEVSTIPCLDWMMANSTSAIDHRIACWDACLAKPSRWLLHRPLLLRHNG